MFLFCAVISTKVQAAVKSFSDLDLRRIYFNVVTLCSESYLSILPVLCSVFGKAPCSLHRRFESMSEFDSRSQSMVHSRSLGSSELNKELLV